jgi:hypothetical protein
MGAYPSHVVLILSSAKLGCMDLNSHFQLPGRYNCIANERLLGACAQLDDAVEGVYQREPM